MKNIFIRLFAGLGLLALLQPASAVTFTNLPAAISNTYNGTITLMISNIPTGASVTVQKFIDLNTNGIVDTNDILVQAFTLTDGTNNVIIGGVTNLNAPGDFNSTTGAVTATLNFNNGDFMQTLVARYLYVISSTNGLFPSLTNAFTVTNFPFPQKFTGNIVSNGTSTTLSNSVVVVFPPQIPGHDGPGHPLGGTVANAAGQYSFAAPAGSYLLMPFNQGYVTDSGSAPQLTLGTSQTLATNLSLIPAITNLSGRMVHADNTNKGIPGVFMPIVSTNRLIAIAFTDTNGYFNARVSANNQWTMNSDDVGLIIHGYVGYNNNYTNVNSGTTNILLPFAKATSLFYGTVKDAQGNPLAGIDVQAYDYNNNIGNNVYGMDGYTDTNGNFFVGAVGGLGANDTWQLSLSSESLATLTNYIVSVPAFNMNGGTNLNSGVAVLQNFTALLATNKISGRLLDNLSNPITNVQLYASMYVGSTNYSSQVYTDNGGNYSFNVANGSWAINVSCGTGNNTLPTNYFCPNTLTVNITNNNVATNILVQPCSISISTNLLASGEINVPYSQSIQASDCSGIYNWSQTGGSVPNGLNLYSGGYSYNLSGIPTTPGNFTFTVQVSDGNGNVTNRQFTVAISNALQIATLSPLPKGTNGFYYNQQLQVTGGQPNYTWSLFSGSLPIGINWSPTGQISGTPTVFGNFNFTMQVSDILGGTNIQPYSLTIQTTNPPPAVNILTAGGQYNGQVLIYFPTDGTNFTLQTATNVNGPWTPASNGTIISALVFTNALPAQFFKLQ